jgi:hypothetical protein
LQPVGCGFEFAGNVGAEWRTPKHAEGFAVAWFVIVRLLPAIWTSGFGQHSTTKRQW